MLLLLHAYICFLGFSIVSSILNMGKQCPVTVVSLQHVFPARSRDIPWIDSKFTAPMTKIKAFLKKYK